MDIYADMPLWVFNIIFIFALYVWFYLKMRLHSIKKIKPKNSVLAGRMWSLDVGGSSVHIQAMTNAEWTP